MSTQEADSPIYLDGMYWYYNIPEEQKTIGPFATRQGASQSLKAYYESEL